MIAMCTMYNVGTGARKDGGNFIQEALDSFYRTTGGRVHLIVIDDCSTDDSAELARLFIRHDRNRGVRAAMGTALEYVGKKELLVRFDADVVFTEPDWDLKLKEHMATHPECTIAGAAQYTKGLSEAGGTLFPQYQHVRKPIVGAYRVCDTIMGCLSCFRIPWMRDVIEDITTLRCETEDLCCKAWSTGGEVHCVNFPFRHLHYLKNVNHCNDVLYNAPKMRGLINEYMHERWGIVWTDLTKKPNPERWPRKELGKYHDMPS